MLQPRRMPRFAEESFFLLGISKRTGSRQLDCYLPLQFGIGSQVDQAECSHTKFAKQNEFIERGRLGLGAGCFDIATNLVLIAAGGAGNRIARGTLDRESTVTRLALE
jgi:hypothetical protein